MNRVVERTPFGVRLEEASGDPRFVLLRCPSCGEQFARLRWHSPVEVEVDRTGFPNRSVHFASRHGPGDFGDPVIAADGGRPDQEGVSEL